MSKLKPAWICLVEGTKPRSAVCIPVSGESVAKLRAQFKMVRAQMQGAQAPASGLVAVLN